MWIRRCKDNLVRFDKIGVMPRQGRRKANLGKLGNSAVWQTVLEGQSSNYLE